ncbi:hypothetical protein STCU_11478 [Strigomonas culicis]|uniref:Uncharacterized protein n=1 Tax=Strigomonas culicis TaxID=28005 RepID=S9V0A7_9TRYP|nr:hypothetical protein STCU_11478 [Strigomonas culicis]|eukprot:EPY16205.1 hypothetical protein STCU_11478 [Strigomonas culicis]
MVGVVVGVVALLALLTLIVVLVLCGRRKHVVSLQACEIVEPEPPVGDQCSVHVCTEQKEDVACDEAVMLADGDGNPNPLSAEIPAEPEVVQEEAPAEPDPVEDLRTPRAARSGKRTARRAKSACRSASMFEDVDLDAMYNDTNEIMEEKSVEVPVDP